MRSPSSNKAWRRWTRWSPLNLPDLTPSFRFDLAQRDELPRIWTFVDRFHRASIALIVLGALLVALALVIGPGRWMLFLILGVVGAGTSLLLGIAADRADRELAARLGSVSTAPAATAVAERFAQPFASWADTGLIASGLVAVVGVAVRLLTPQRARWVPPATPADDQEYAVW
ncbi:MAG: hypothetical protein R2705_22575 [Ilumatobacteraceae bacterium]